MFEMDFPESMEEMVVYLFLGALCAVAAIIFVIFFKKYSEKELEKTDEVIEQRLKERELREESRK